MAGTLGISFLAAQRNNSGTPEGQEFTVSVGSTVVGTFTPATIDYAIFSTTPLLLAAGTYELTFTGLNPLGTDNTAFLDGVTLAFAPVVTFDASADFTVDAATSTSANGRWQYGWLPDLTSPAADFTLDDVVSMTWGGITGFSGYTSSVGSTVLLGNFTSPPETIIQSSAVCPVGFVVTSPGPSHQYGALRFLAPSAGVYALSGQFQGQDTSGATTDVHVLHITASGTSTSLFSGSVDGYYGGDGGTPSGPTPVVPFALTGVALAVGDSLIFAVGDGGNGYYSDTTGLAVSVTATPTLPAFDAVAEFTLDAATATSASGAWQYGSLPDLTGPATAFGLFSVTTMTWGGVTGLEGYVTPASGFNAPLLVANLSSPPVTLDYTTATPPPGFFEMHPGDGGTGSGPLSALRFVAPESGIWTFTGMFQGQDTNGTTTDVHVLQVTEATATSVSLFSATIDGYYGGTGAPSGTSPFAPFSLAGIALSAGDSLLFVVGDGGNGYYGDSTGLQVQANLGYVPAAGSLVPDDAFGYLGGLGYWQDPALSASGLDGSGLSYVRQRWLENATGQWLSVDPVDSEPRYSYVKNSPTFGVDPEGTDGIFGFNSVQEFWDTISYIPEATEDEAYDLRNQLQEYLVMNIGSLVGFGADANAIAHRWLTTYGNIKSHMPPPMQAVMPPSTSLTEVADWMEAFATNYLIGFGTEALQAGKQMLMSAIPGYNAYQQLIGSFEQAKQIVAFVKEIVQDSKFFKSLGVSFEVFLVRHVGGPLLNALIAVMNVKAIPPEILGSIAGAIAFQVFLLIIVELASEGLATAAIAAEEATEAAAILGRLAQGTGRIGRAAQKAQKLVADYQDVIDFANSLKNRVDLGKKAKQWLGKIMSDGREVKSASSHLNSRHGHIGAKIEALKNEEKRIFHKKVTWTATKSRGTGQTYVVYQRDDIDWNRIRTRRGLYQGKTNEYAARHGGVPPELADGRIVGIERRGLEIVQLHHINKNGKGRLAEVSSITHGHTSPEGNKTLHGIWPRDSRGKEVGNPDDPIDRRKFDVDREEYWMWRVDHK